MIGSGEPIPALVEPSWDREAVGLSPRAVRQFAGRHRIDEDQAEEELFDVPDDAAVRGRQERTSNGNHRPTVDGWSYSSTAARTRRTISPSAASTCLMPSTATSRPVGDR